MADRHDPTVTLRMPLSTWRGIVNGIQKWAGESAGEIEILSDVELMEGDPAAVWWLNDPDDDTEDDDA
jgi:hypothetical protein